MKVIQFAFDSREGSDYLPHTYTSHCVVYTGTHDNDTVMGWMKTAPKASVKFAIEYLNLTEEEGYNWGYDACRMVFRCRYGNCSDAGSDRTWLEARINIPSTLGENWKWRALEGQITKDLAKKLYKYMQMYGRINEKCLRKQQRKQQRRKLQRRRLPVKEVI